MSADQIERAQRWLANGYPPVPISRHDGPTSMVRAHDGKVIKLSPGKQPHGLLWSKKATVSLWRRRRHHRRLEAAPRSRRLPRPRHRVRRTSSGPTSTSATPSLAAVVEALVRERLGDTPLRRVGQAPKVLLLYRADGQPLLKAMTDVFLKDETKAQVEFMASGQQVVGTASIQIPTSPTPGLVRHLTPCPPQICRP